MDLFPELSIDDDDPASQQLLLEFHTPRYKPPPSYNSSVVRSAHLLNAARVEKHQTLTSSAIPSSQSSLGGRMVPRNGGNGKLNKLKHPTLLAENFGTRRQAGAGKRPDVYALPASPERELGVILSQTVNKRPIKVLRTGKHIIATAGQLELSSELASPMVEYPDLTALDLALPELTPDLAHPELLSNARPFEDPRAELRILTNSPSSSVEPSSPLAESRSSPPLLPSPVSIETHLSSGQPRCTALNSSGAGRNKGRQCRNKGLMETSDGRRCRAHAKGHQDVNGEDSNRRKSGRLAGEEVETVVDWDKTPGRQENITSQNKSPKRKAEVSQLELSKAPKSPKIQDDEESEHSEANHAGKKSELDRVFEFLESEERDGVCQTNEGDSLYKACNRACELIVEHDLSRKEILEMSDIIRDLLKTFRINSVEDPKAFKIDSYGYLFRALTRFLEAVHNWVQQNEETLGLLPAMQILTPLVRDILLLKDSVTFSKVQIPQRYKGDRIVKEVEEKLIVPLRKVDEIYRAELSQLEYLEQVHKKRDELYSLQREKWSPEGIQAQQAYKQKLAWWQYLEVVRLQCEPEPHRRRMLAPPRIDNTGGRDSDGVSFERVPLFVHRETHLPPSITLRDWTDTESIVLADALQTFAGPSPHVVFESIFKAHCRVGGALRNFSVTDIVTRAACRRADYIELYQKHGWELDEWIKQIPVLL
ncbi:hypothetical protein K505DRAFT_374819 [Melanomma pulvis-pyrius CBS 109.77]|uniref:Uncharacterized protein n=1 Tax=Melanomma pulvis-pyrius CBS 109.77 TaxID=1314802 RepID=A0A6A6XC65_9PLEO|nr:hypothetical protein K505DRAFT_374819 [Melanomma pulvis-pyrius CBS 109.77]